MRDWQRYVRERLTLPDLEASRSLEAVEEIAGQLEDVYRAARARGLPEVDADAEACAHVLDWERLASEIRAARPSRRRPAASRWADRADSLGRRRGPWGHWIADLGLDVRYAWRMLRRSPGFTFVVVLILGLGIGVNTALFSVLRAVVLQPLAYPGAERLAVLWETTTRGGRGPASFLDYLDWQARNRSFETMGALSGLSVNLTGGVVPERILAARATASLFDVFDVPPALGRTFEPKEDRSDARVAVISHELWTSRFASDPEILGRPIRLSDEPYTIIGVMPAEFTMLSPWVATDRYQLWIPFAADVRDERRDSHSYPVIGRLRPGVTEEMAQDDLDRVALELADEYPATNLTQRVWVQPLHDVLFGSTRRQLLLVLATTALLLLIACGNVASLLLARATSRGSEIAIRVAVGAGRGRIVRQLLAESALLAILGGGVALVMEFWAIGALRGALPAWVPRTDQIRMDAWSAAFSLAVTVAAALLFGLAPALLAGRDSHVESLKEGARGAAGQAGHGWLRNAFVVVQLALTLILLHGTTLLLGSYFLLLREDLGFDSTNVLTAAISPAGAAYDDPAAREALYVELIPRLESLPGVRRAAVVSKLPLRGGNNDRVVVDGRAVPPDPNDRLLVERSSVVGGYLAAVGIPLRAGRDLQPGDAIPGRAGAVINERMAEQLWPGEDALGKRFSFGEGDDPDEWLTVVGIAGNVRQWGLESRPIAEAYRPYLLFPRQRMYIVVRTDVDPDGLVDALRREVLAVDPNLPISEVRTMGNLVAETFARRALMTGAIGFFALLAVILGVAGTYGVTAYFVVQRTHEIGVRVALGAGRARVLRYVAASGARLAALGVILGAVGALAAARVIQAILYEMRASDPLVLAATALLLFVVATASTLIPARRATAVDPIRALRAE